MRAVILTDRSFAEREQSMLDRLEIGLVDEGIRVSQILPESLDARATVSTASLCTTNFRFSDRGFGFTLRPRIAALVRSIGDADESTDHLAPIDVVHCFGGAAWPAAIEFARQTGARVVLEIWRATLIDEVLRLLRRWPTTLPLPALATPDSLVTHALSSQLRSRAAVITRTTPWGVHVPDRPIPSRDPDRPISIGILTTGWDGAATTRSLEGLARAMNGRPPFHLFVNSDAAIRAGLWSTCKRIGLIDALSLVPDFEGRRAPALGVDLLMLPEAIGRHHSFTIDAMAAGIAIVARPDPFVEYLAHDVTAHLVADTSAPGWAASIQALVDDRESCARLGESSRRYIATHRTASAHVRAIIDLYDAVVSKATAAVGYAGKGAP